MTHRIERVEQPVTAQVLERVDQRGKAYRTFLAVASRSPLAAPSGDFLPRVEDQLAVWLRNQKDLDLDVSHDNDLVDGSRSITILHHEGGHDLRHLKAVLVEDSPKGAWRTQLLASSEGWVDLTVSNSEGQMAAVPNLAKFLLECLPLGDGAVVLDAEPRRIQVHEVQDLVETLLDEERHGLAFVAGTGREDILEPFYNRIPRWARQIYGLGQVYVLTPEATEAFNKEMGAFGALPWSIRTFFPRIDRGDLTDSRRHRYLTAPTLGRLKDGHITHLLGEIARTHAATRPEPYAVVRTRRIFDRLEARRLTDAMVAVHEPLEPPQEQPEVWSRPAGLETESPLPGVEPRVVEVSDDETTVVESSRHPVIALVRRVLGVDEVSEGSLLARLRRERESSPAAEFAATTAARLERLQDEKDRLEDELKEARDALDDAQLEEAELFERVEALEQETRWFRDRLRAAEDFEGAHAEPSVMGLSELDRPSDLLDLVTRLNANALPGVVFCGDESETERVATRDTMGNAARVAWDACCALSDYTKVIADGSFEGSVDHYLKNGPDGSRKVSPKKHGAAETPATMNQFGAERVFPVPSSVDNGGRITMEAHFKLARIGMISPRMYYLDRTREDGNVYIGYIGKHLRNTQTN